jgi:hypothetical protein
VFRLSKTVEEEVLVLMSSRWSKERPTTWEGEEEGEQRGEEGRERRKGK